MTALSNFQSNKVYLVPLNTVSLPLWKKIKMLPNCLQDYGHLPSKETLLATAKRVLAGVDIDLPFFFFSLYPIYKLPISREENLTRLEHPKNCSNLGT